MELTEVMELVETFNSTSQGHSNYDKDQCYVQGEDHQLFAPLSYIIKKSTVIKEKENGLEILLDSGLIYASFDYVETSKFKHWYEKTFSKKSNQKMLRSVVILYKPYHKVIFDALNEVTKCYEILRENRILINNKNLPIQLGEWYAKVIFGLLQQKSASQRGFDFLHEKERIEVKVHWNDKSSPKGVKIKKSMVTLAKTCIVIYISRNFMIRDICVLDSDFILRKFAGKGHTIFLKDTEIAPYFFSKSTKHFSLVVNKSALLTFASPSFALKLQDRV